MKKTLLAVKDKDIEVLSSSLNSLIQKFHSDEYKITDSVVNSEYSSFAAVGCSTSISKASTLGSSVTSVVKEEHDGDNLHSSDSSPRNISQSLSVSLLEQTQDQLNKSNHGDNIEPQNSDKDEPMEEDSEYEKVDSQDLMAKMEDIISKAKYQTIGYNNAVVPEQIIVDMDLVAKIKNLLQHTPDKTQTFIGTIKHVDYGGDAVGPHEVWVNPELFLALKELNTELGDSGPSNRVYAVVHEVFETDEIGSVAVGLFLNANNKDFAEKVHVKMIYNDLIRLSVSVISEEDSVRTKAFLKLTLNSFSKGRKNSGFFIKFASLPSEYLVMFEEFLRKYEQGSILGQGIPLRRLVNLDSKKNEVSRIEIPINLLKDHLCIDQKSRQTLLCLLLEEKITFKEYKLKLIKAKKLSKTKSKVETISGQPFPVLKETCPDLMSDEMLEEFSEAKQDNRGHNAVYSKLVTHVQAVLGKAGDGRADVPVAIFKERNEINLTNITKSVKDQDAIVFHYSEDKEFNALYEFAINEEVTKNSSVFAIFIELNEKVLRSEMCSHFPEDSDLVVEFIFVKRDHSINVGGFKKDFFPISVVGHKDYFKNKEVKTFYSCSLKEAISYILSDTLQAACSRVLYAFNEKEHAFDLDPNSTLAKKKVCVTYHGNKEDLDMLEKVIDNKVV